MNDLLGGSSPSLSTNLCIMGSNRKRQQKVNNKIKTFKNMWNCGDCTQDDSEQIMQLNESRVKKKHKENPHDNSR